MSKLWSGKICLCDRKYVCEECGVVLDWDLNPSLNIFQIGIKKLELNEAFGEVTLAISMN